MKELMKIRAVLQGLAIFGVLIQYTAAMHTGQRLRVWSEAGTPVSMTLGTARAYLRRLEDNYWWGAKAA